MLDKDSKRFKKIIKDLIIFLESKLSDKLSEIWLFGSVARGEGKITSDIDIMVSINGEMISREKRFEIYGDLIDVDPSGEMIDLVFKLFDDDENFTYSDIFRREFNKDKILLKSYTNDSVK